MTWDNLRLWLYWLFENAGAEAKTSYTSVISGHWSDTERETANISATVWTSQAYGISRYRDTSPVEPNTEKLHSMTIKAGTEFHYRRNHNWQVDGGGTSAWSEMAHPSGASFNLSWVLLPCNHLTAGQLWIRKSEARKPKETRRWQNDTKWTSWSHISFWLFEIFAKQSQHESNMSPTIYRSQISLFVKRLRLAKIPNFVMQKAPKAPYNIEHGSVCRHCRHSNDRPRHVGQLDVWRGTWVSILLPSVINIRLWKMEASTLTTFTTRSTSGGCIPVGNEQIPWCFLQLVQCSGASGAWTVILV